MEAFDLTTPRLVLDRPVDADVDDIAGFCTDPVFERYLTTPWPYRRADAEGFVRGAVPSGWAEGREWTWAIRVAAGAPLLGVVSVRLASGMVGFWLGAPHRGGGVMTEALSAVVDAVLERTDLDLLRWECVPGNSASAAVARKCGFRWTGERRGLVSGRDGERELSWTGELSRTDDRAPKSGWPA